MSIPESNQRRYPASERVKIRHPDTPPRARGEFDVRLLAQVHETWSSKLLHRFLTHDALRVLRTLTPILRFPAVRKWRFPSFTLVFRFDDVIDVLEHDRVFKVLGERIKRSNAGLNFLLGMPDDQERLGQPIRQANGDAIHEPRCPVHRDIDPSDRGYRSYQAQVQSLFKREDLPMIAQLVDRHAEKVLRTASHADVDVIERLVTGCPIQVCREYYGLEIPDDQEFKHWLFMLSRWDFDPLEPSLFEAAALEASQRLNELIDRSIAADPHPERTVLGRMLAQGLDRARLRVIMSGMVLGFVPTNTMAGDHILGQLLEHPEMQDRARCAARLADPDPLKRCLFEAFRFDPLDREPLRVCTQDYTLAAGKWYSHKVRAGDQLILMTRSAMMDHSAFVDPHKFDPERREYNKLLFGYGLHRCIGAPLAETQLTSMFKVLLANRSLERVAGSTREALGPFATSLKLRITPLGRPYSVQSLSEGKS
jgi:cytochrome P450